MSDLDSDDIDDHGIPAPPAGPAIPTRDGRTQSIRQLSTADIHGRRASAVEMHQIIEELQLADEVWEEAQAAIENAPPDSGFPHPLARARRRV